MIDIVNVIGSGRVGSAIGARLGERGVAVAEDGAELVLLCVPDDLHVASASVAPASVSYRCSSCGSVCAIRVRCASTVAQSPREIGPVSS